MFFLLLTWVGLLLLFTMMFHCGLADEEVAAKPEGDCFVDSSFSSLAVLRRLAAESHNQLTNCCLKEAKLTRRPTPFRSVVYCRLTSQSKTQSLK